jgi:hypothetical protein
MLNDHTARIEASQEPHAPVSLAKNESMATAVTAIKALREHGNVGVARNLAAAEAIDALKTSLDRGDFGRFCTVTLQISTSYRARLLKLNKVRKHVSSAQAWAATRKHRLAECQSAQNLIKLVNDWLKRDEPPKPRAVSKRQEARPGQDDATESESAIQEGADHVVEREKTISELKTELANRDDAISDLQRRLAECDQDFIALRDPLSHETRHQASFALASSREHEFVAIAKRCHWRTSDLRREVEN